MQQLKLREVLLWPRYVRLSRFTVAGIHLVIVRFHELVVEDLLKRKADIVELYQPLTDNMKDIQTAVIECMEATLSEIKRSNTFVSLNRSLLIVYCYSSLTFALSSSK